MFRTFMKIGIDARMYGARQTGIGNYIRHLTENLFKIDRENQYFVFLLKPEFSRYRILSPQVKKIKVRARWYTLSEQLIFASVLNRYNLDLMHFPHFNAPFLYRGKYVLTVHDITQKYFPGASFWRKQAYQFIFSHNIKAARRVIAVSRFTKNNILNNFSCEAKKIKVIYEGVDSRFKPGNKDEALIRLRQKYPLNKPFILYAGVMREHKNVVGLVSAFNLFLKKYRLDYQLVLVGNFDPRYTEIQTKIDRLKLNKKVVQPGFVSFDELLLFYQAAEVLVLPSFREGFGFTPLEAISCGTPVAASNTTSLPEILGKAACYFDPYDIKNMAETIYKILEDRNLQDVLVCRGQKMIKNFSWTKCASATLKLYQEAAALK